MIRTLLATTALTMLMTAGAYAQAAAPAAADSMTAPADSVAAPVDKMAAPADKMAPAASGDMTKMMAKPFSLAQGYAAADTDNLATRLIGQPLFSSKGEDAENIGDVTDLVFADDGRIAAVVVGVGGFLGIGEKSVAVDFSDLEFTVAADNTERWILPTTADELKAAPDFVWREDEPAAADKGAVAPAAGNTGAMAPAVPVDNTAAAPADKGVMTDNSANLPAGYTAVTTENLTAENLQGAKVVSSDGEDIADVGDIVLTEDGKVDAMLIDFGGFLGIGQKRVAVGMDNLQFATDEGGQYFVYVNFTKDQLEQQPEYNSDTYPTARDEQRLVAR